jgi:nucleoid-associated protein YgaU
MTAVAAALRALTGPWQALLSTLAHASTVSATAGPEDVVLAAAGLLAWAVWAWGALGLVLTAASAAPGAGGAVARGMSRLLLPASLRTASGLALGVGLVITAPTAVAAPAVASAAVAVPDWPADDPAPSLPDWPAAPPPAEKHVVVAGDCLWRIAESRLLETGSDPTDAAVARAVDRWWRTNADVIGPDPDLIRPGQVLLPPSGTSASTEQPSRSTR